MGMFSLVTGWAGPSGFGSASTSEQVTEGIDASKLTAIITGHCSLLYNYELLYFLIKML